MEDASFGFDDFSVDIDDSKIRKTKEFDRMWKVEPGGSMAQIPLVHDGVIYFGSCNRNVYAVSIDTGELIWKYKTEGIILDSSPTFWNGRIFIASFDYNLYSLDANTGELLWKFKTEGEVDIKPFVYEDKVYFGSRDQNIYCVDANTGQEIWRKKTFGEIISSPNAVNGKVYIGSTDQNFYCLDADTGDLIWKHETQGEIHNSNTVLVLDGVVYFGSFDNYLRAVDAETGRLIWKLKTGIYGNFASPVPYKGVLYHVCRDGVLFAITPGGEVLWSKRENEIMTFPCIFEDRIYLGSDDKNLHCLDLNGRELWKFETQGMVWIQPVTSGRNVFFTSWDCHLYSVDIDTTRLSWKFRVSGSPSFVPDPHESFELEMKIPQEEFLKEKRKVYDLDEEKTEVVGSFYRSRNTYQVTSEYQASGSYRSNDVDF